ncbi:MAG: hypothetical protein K8I00_07380 [Candidatus Omnitrophica bacterium]|nr:hypothetical protein [Candidatus Omnitrophota bacterium]
MDKIFDQISYLLFGSKENDISILLDKNLDYFHRDAAAESLLKRDYDANTLAAFFRVASDPTESVDLLEECGEDLAIVWTALDQCPATEDLNRLRPEARAHAYAIIKSRKPAWLKNRGQRPN